MSIHTKLLAGSGLVAVTLLSGTAAQAAMHHKHAHHAAMKSGPSSEVTELKAEVEALSARLEAAEAAQRITADQAATASANAQSAAAQSAQTSAMVAKGGAAISGQIKSAINAYASSGSDTKVTGQVFFNSSNINLQNNGVKGVPSGTGFDIKRLYVGVEHKFNNTFSAVGIIDANASGAYTSNANLNGANVFIKNVYLQAKFNDAFIVRVGSAPMPWIPYVEGVNGQRYVEQMFVDRTKLGNTADYGLHALGTLGNAKGFNVTYAAAVVNGGGFKNPTRSNSVDLEGRVAANYKGFTAAVGGYTGKLAADAQGVNSLHTATRLDGFVGYVGPRFRIGGEYLWAKNFSQGIVVGTTTSAATTSYVTAAGCTTLPCSVTVVTTPGVTTLVPEDVAEGFSGFASFNVTPKFSVSGRYDTIKPNKYTAPLRKEEFFDIVATYNAYKNVDLSLVYKHDVLNNNGGPVSAGGFGTQDATLGKGVQRTTYDEVGLFGRWAF